MGNAAGSGYCKGDSARISAGIIDNTDRLEEMEDKVDIIMPKKTNKTLILVCYS